MENAIQTLFFLAILIFSVVIHEVSHGYAALYLGDKTAAYAGRLTLNPIPHLDLFGSFILPFLLLFAGSPVLLGWAKPVPYNPYNLRNQKWGPAVVGVAGPLANVLLAVAFGLMVRFVPGLAGSFSPEFIFNFLDIARMITLLNLGLAVFNLIPLPPLDGSKLLLAVWPLRWQATVMFLERYGFLILLVLLFSFGPLLSRAVFFLFRLLAGVPFGF